MKKEKPQPLLLENLIAVASASVGSPLFRNLYARVGNRKVDILKNGELSCAFFVSAVLKMFSLVRGVHATVAGTVRDLKTSGWRTVRKPKPGCVIVWRPKTFADGEAHAHIGFYIGRGLAVSTSYKKRTPVTHALRARPIEAIYSHP